MRDENLVYVTDETKQKNWFYRKYNVAGANARYMTFQLALNILNQLHDSPVIIETGCQREKDDLGAGMSTSIFAEYVQTYGGKLITVDNNPVHLARAKEYVKAFPGATVEFVEADSVSYLQSTKEQCRLLYLDSLDYPIGAEAGDEQKQRAAQEHNLNEFLAAEDKLLDKGVLLLDDNLLPGGGKPKVLKNYLKEKGWICLLDYQQSVWVKGL